MTAYEEFLYTLAARTATLMYEELVPNSDIPANMSTSYSLWRDTLARTLSRLVARLAELEDPQVVQELPAARKCAQQHLVVSVVPRLTTALADPEVAQEFDRALVEEEAGYRIERLVQSLRLPRVAGTR
jgi:hypothetical protein